MKSEFSVTNVSHHRESQRSFMLIVRELEDEVVQNERRRWREDGEDRADR